MATKTLKATDFKFVGSQARPPKINGLFLILCARSFLSDYGKNKGKNQMFIFHFLIKIIVSE